jgi:hypothetical protein
VSCVQKFGGRFVASRVFTFFIFTIYHLIFAQIPTSYCIDR